MARLTDCERTEPPFAAGEKEMVTAFLDWQRASIPCKLAGLSDDVAHPVEEPVARHTSDHTDARRGRAVRGSSCSARASQCETSGAGAPTRMEAQPARPCA